MEICWDTLTFPKKVLDLPSAFGQLVFIFCFLYTLLLYLFEQLNFIKAKILAKKNTFLHEVWENSKNTVF